LLSFVGLSVPIGMTRTCANHRKTYNTKT
jgi:hypothetical protein